LQRLCLYVIEPATDFGTGLRAHLGLEQQLEVAAEPLLEPVEVVSEIAAAAADAAPESAALEALATLEFELLERERLLAMREERLQQRAGALLAAARALYDEVVDGTPPTDDELTRMRRRKSGA
jgi:hypothetical protein